MRNNKNIIVSFRLPADEYERLKEAADAKGESVSAFARRAVKERKQGGMLCCNAISGTRYSNLNVTSDAPEYWTSGGSAEFTIEQTVLLPYKLL